MTDRNGVAGAGGQLIASVVIPAHNEESVIGRCLRTLLAGAPPGSLEVIVAANGCTDRTVEVARSVAGVRVVEVAEAGKAKALNAGDAAATVLPRFYLDADIELGYPALVTTVREMTERGALAAAPRLVRESTGCSRVVRAYYSVWEQMPYAREELVGVGVYALSAAGRQRFESFPGLIADDLFIRNLFSAQERLAVRDATFTVHPPKTLRDLIQVQTRVWVGNGELQQQVAHNQVESAAVSESRLRWVGRRLLLLLSKPRVWPAIPVHLVVYLLVRLRGRRYRKRGNYSWLRDDSSREPADRGAAESTGESR